MTATNLLHRMADAQGIKWLRPRSLAAASTVYRIKSTMLNHREARYGRQANQDALVLMIRKIHAYLGLMIAPSVLFFAFSGTLQLFSLHEAHGPYHPPAIFRTLGNIHKDQVLSEPDKHHGPPVASAAAHHNNAGPPQHDENAPQVKTYVMKWLFALVGLGLFSSTLLGLWIGLRFTRTPLLSWGLLVVGVIAPLLVLLA